MRIQSALLCDAAVIVGGKLYVIGAGLASYWLAGFPDNVTVMLAAVVEADPDLDRGVVQFTIRAIDTSTATTLLEGKLDVQINAPAPAGVPLVLPLSFPLQIPVAAPTTLDIVIEAGAGIEARLPLAVLPAPRS